MNAERSLLLSLVVVAALGTGAAKASEVAGPPDHAPSGNWPAFGNDPGASCCNAVTASFTSIVPPAQIDPRRRASAFSSTDPDKFH